MADNLRAVSWEAPEHHHIEKTSDWYWAVGIISITAATVSILFGNALFGIVIILGAVTVVVFAHREPAMLEFEVSNRGIRSGNDFVPFTQLESFYLDEEDPMGPQLLVKPLSLFGQLIILPLPEESVDDIDEIIAARLPEEHLEEPFGHRLLEFFGF